MRFLCLAYGDEMEWKRLSASQQEQLLAQDDVLRRRGDIVEAVDPPTIVRTREGRTTTAAGPLVRPPLPLAGFGVIEARDLAEAIELVAKTPCAVAGGAVEIWPARDLS